MNRTLGLVSATLLTLAGAAGAAENLGGFVDMRLGYGTLVNSDYECHVSTGAGSQDVNGDFDTSHRLSLDWIGCLGMRSYGGVLWGVGANWGYETGEILNQEYTMQQWTVRANLGYGIAITDMFQLEAIPFAGTGRSSYKGSGSHFSDAPYWEYGANANAVFTFSNSIQLGATAGFLWYETSVFDEEISVRQKFRADGFDLMAGGFIGVRL